MKCSTQRGNLLLLLRPQRRKGERRQGNDFERIEQDCHLIIRSVYQSPANPASISRLLATTRDWHPMPTFFDVSAAIEIDLLRYLLDSKRLLERAVTIMQKATSESHVRTRSSVRRR